jgi:hypothetical protein
LFDVQVLEMVCTVAPQLFTDWENFPSAEMNISRLFQLVTQAFNRLTASANIFENVTRLHLPGKLQTSRVSSRYSCRPVLSFSNTGLDLT